MSKEQKQSTINVYGVFDNELERMHSLLNMYLQMSDRGGGTHGAAASSAMEIYQRLKKMQDVLTSLVESHDKTIQDKVAELALTGDSNDET